MSLTENGNLVMPVGPMNGNGGAFGGFGDDGWLIILFLFALMGNNGFGFGGGNNQLYPWMNQSDQINGGFRDQMINGNIDQIRNGISDVQMGLASGFAGVEQSANARQIANMQTAFNLQSQFANCCCENRLGLANLGSDLAREACANRTLDTQNSQTVLNAINAGVQSIKDQMCQDKIDAKNEKIADLERQLTMANLAAQAGANTSRILADNAAQTVALEQYLNPTAVPAYIVQNPNGCNCGYNCGCGA